MVQPFHRIGYQPCIFSIIFSIALECQTIIHVSLDNQSSFSFTKANLESFAYVAALLPPREVGFVYDLDKQASYARSLIFEGLLACDAVAEPITLAPSQPWM